MPTVYLWTSWSVATPGSAQRAVLVLGNGPKDDAQRSGTPRRGYVWWVEPSTTTGGRVLAAVEFQLEAGIELATNCERTGAPTVHVWGFVRAPHGTGLVEPQRGWTSDLAEIDPGAVECSLDPGRRRR